MHFPTNLYNTDEWRSLRKESRMLLLYLFTRSNMSNECWPSLNKITADLRLKKQTALSAIQELCKSGLISKSTIPGIKSTYTLHSFPESERSTELVSQTALVTQTAPVTGTAPDQCLKRTTTGAPNGTGPVPFETPEQYKNSKRTEQQQCAVALLMSEGISEEQAKGYLGESWADREDVIGYITERVQLIKSGKFSNRIGALVKALRSPEWISPEKQAQECVKIKNLKSKEQRDKRIGAICEKLKSGQSINDLEYYELHNQVPAEFLEQLEVSQIGPGEGFTYRLQQDAITSMVV